MALEQIEQERLDAAWRVQIEMAAAGCVNGTLAQWPLLRSALKSRGYDLPLMTPASELVRICRELLAHGA